MNIANLSLDSVGGGGVGGKAQGINTVLISIINQQEEREWRREAARKCKARRNEKKYASFRPVSAGRQFV